jgi:hypothetical protein
MENLTFNELPQAVTQLYDKLNNIERLLLQKSNESKPEPDCWFDINELCNYLPDKPARPTVYGWVHLSLIPCHKGQKKLRFLKSEIDAWLKLGRKKTLSEISSESDKYLKTN